MLSEYVSQPSCKGDYKMIESLEIENFRCYERVTLSGLQTINLIVGGNASGKTALLEALYFTLGNPLLAFKLKIWRGIGGQVQFTEATETRSGAWRDLFYNFDQDRPVKIALRGTSDINRSVRITCRKQESHFVSSKKHKPLISEIPPITFEYSHGSRVIATVKPDFSGDGIALTGTPEPLSGSFFPNTLQIDPQETARHFSNLSKMGRLQPVIVALQDLFPMIDDLSLEINNSLPVVFAKVKGVAERMPIGLVSTGVAQMVTYLVSIADKHGVGGVVIIDEIENGFYYAKMEDIWRVLHKFCLGNNVQLFASTHSAECLNSAAKAAEGSEGDFSLLRTERENGNSIVEQFDGLTFRRAIQQHIEVR